MSWLHKTQSTYGRLVPKPEILGRREEIGDEALPLQDQIENLRLKISLKERYNKALRDDLMESNEGASSYIQELTIETKELRQRLMDAINSEKSAVQNALRTHREFQLAMTNKTPAIAIPWLDDKLFDMAKFLNSLLDMLKDKRKRLEESEQMVMTIEKWPRPGTLPWELEAHAAFNRLECLIEGQRIKRETAFILNSKYIEIKYQLLAEKGKYTSILKNMESGLRTLKNELTSLETMLDDAIYFRNEAYKNLTLTEKEASENRKRRRIQMSKMKKAVEKILEENQRAPKKANTAAKVAKAVSMPLISNTDAAEHLKVKRQEVEEFQERARKIVETMRVPDLTYIPVRLRTVSRIGAKLQNELDSKEKLRDLYVNQRSQLLLILSYFQYTGVHQLEEYTDFSAEYQKNISEANARQREVLRKMDKIGSINLDVRFGIYSILDHLNLERKKGRMHADRDDLIACMRTCMERITKLLEQTKELQILFKRKEPERNYGYYVKTLVLPVRLIRVGTPQESEESDGEEDVIDYKVPGRVDIKAKSARFLNQALLKRGIH